MPNITKTEADVFIPEIWAQEVFGYLKAWLVMPPLIMRDTDLGVSANQPGDTIHVDFAGSLSINDKSPNTPVVVQNPAGTQLDIVLNKHKEITFLVEDPVRVFSFKDQADLYIGEAAKYLAEQIDTDILAMYALLPYHIGLGGAFTDPLVRMSRLELNKRKIPKERVMVVSADGENDLLALDRFTTPDKYGSAIVPSGELGRLYGMPVYMTQLIPQTLAGTSPALTVSHNLMFNKKAMAIAFRGLPLNAAQIGGARQATVSDPDTGIVLRVTTSYNPNHLGVQVTLDILYGVKVIRGDHANVIRTYN